MGTKMINVGVVGATGIVGTEFLKILAERKLPIEELRPFASETSKGRKIAFRGQQFAVKTLEDGCFTGLDLVFFSSGDEISREWAPKAVQEGAFAIDNSNAFRMNPEIPLVVPEVNDPGVSAKDKPCLIANPNCSTIQMVVALQPLYKKFGISSVQAATYQSVSGAGREALEELNNQTMAVLNHQEPSVNALPYQIAFNNLPQIGSFLEDGFTSEEMKMTNETKKILGDESINVSAFCVRTPSQNGHSIAAWIKLKNAATRQEIMDEFKKAAGIELVDDPFNNKYPMNIVASGTDPVYVGRIHQVPNDPKTWMVWIVADNIRKGAALNGIQIAKSIFKLD
jgi:aspartate-semialdehyde dehydrogenase